MTTRDGVLRASRWAAVGAVAAMVAGCSVVTGFDEGELDAAVLIDGQLDCGENQRVQDRVCVDCPPGLFNEAGDRVTDGDTECSEGCRENERVQDNACVACPAGTQRPAGDNPLGEDTTCDVVTCAEDERVSSNACVACDPGTINEAGDEANGDDTTCDIVLCLEDEKVVDNACVPCDATDPQPDNIAGDPANGPDTVCDGRVCPANFRVQDGACVACDPGFFNEAGDPADGADTTCEPRTCGANERVLDFDCAPCPTGTTNPAGDQTDMTDGGSGTTTCDTCATDFRVNDSNQCVACVANASRAAGDDRTGGETSCGCPAGFQVRAGLCEACAPGFDRGPASAPVPGADALCAEVFCAVNQRVVGNLCEDCPGATPFAPAGQSATMNADLCRAGCGENQQSDGSGTCTDCAAGFSSSSAGLSPYTVISCTRNPDCLVNQRVVTANNFSCASCPAGQFNEPGDDPTNGVVTQCNDDCVIDMGTTLGCGGASPFCLTSLADNACVGCLSIDDCVLESAPACLNQGTGLAACGDCTSNGQCARFLTAPFCNLNPDSGGAPNPGQCVECDVDANCGSATPFCSPTTDTCEPCSAGGADFCTGGAACSGSAGTCGPCTGSEGAGGDADCPPASPFCDTSGATNTCIFCDGDAGSASSSACPVTLPDCNTGTGLCEACTDSFCTANSPGTVCDEPSGQCGACTADNGGGGDTACPSSLPNCDTGTCVACDQDFCNTTNRVCVGGACVGCVDDYNEASPTGAQCPAENPVCLGGMAVCTSCTNDTQCLAGETCTGGACVI
jgi:hypothetical protein